MASLNVLDIEGKEIEKIEIPDEIVNQKLNTDILYQEVRRYLASIRAGTHSTKGRSEVSGGGRKPWRQKGTGNARAGSIRSPIWKGGGVVFGPKPRDYSFKLNKKVIRKSRLIALSEKFRDNKILVLNECEFEVPKTKRAADMLNNLNLKGKKVLVVLDNLNSNEAKSFRNLSNVSLSNVKGLNTYNILVSEYVIFTKSSLNKLVEGIR